MAKKKAAGSKASQYRRTQPKHRGVKIFGGEAVVSGNIIVRQLGTVYHPGENVMMGRDYTLFAVAEGIVEFAEKRGKRYVHVKVQNSEI